jgi:hypothetical protein
MRGVTALRHETWRAEVEAMSAALHHKYYLTRGFADRVTVRFPRFIGLRPISGGEAVIGGILVEVPDVHVADALYLLDKARAKAGLISGGAQ